MIGPARAGYLLLRITVATLLCIHGATRVYKHDVGGFGHFLASQHVPFGHIVAWVLSLVEVAGTVALAAGFAVIPLCLWFAAELAVGIVMVHAHQGWFVVGGGTGGMEYSVLLIAALLSIALMRRGGAH
ncbi:MAG: DoxX family protein [bacterium]|nr:DoxX family protein [bacterium]